MESYEPPKLKYIEVCLLKKLRVLGIATIWCYPHLDMQSIA
jgi:hypothetical protein